MHQFCVRKLIISSKEFKKALAHESWAEGILYDEKKEGQKSHDTVPLTHHWLCGRIRPSKSYFFQMHKTSTND
jgi:hypothetical protein